MAQTPKKDILALKDFQYTVTIALPQEGKEANGGKRGRPSLIILEVTALEIRFDSVGHLPDFVHKQGRFRHCPKGFNSIQCVKCKIRLCICKIHLSMYLKGQKLFLQLSRAFLICFTL